MIPEEGSIMLFKVKKHLHQKLYTTRKMKKRLHMNRLCRILACCSVRNLNISNFLLLNECYTSESFGVEFRGHNADPEQISMFPWKLLVQCLGSNCICGSHPSEPNRAHTYEGYRQLFETYGMLLLVDMFPFVNTGSEILSRS